jgi:signal transduction histidine kinase
MGLDASDLYAALMHELKNNLGLLAMAMERIPYQGAEGHDAPLDEARLLCQRVIEKLRQSLLLYKAAGRNLSPDVDAYAPRDFVHQLRDGAVSLARDRVQVQASVAEEVPEIWFFDRNLAELALVNAIHNSLAYARTRIVIEATMAEGMLCLSVRDDSEGYPPHVLEALEQGQAFRSTGTGLGLQLSRMIAGTHENRGRVGELRLSNEGGARFSLLLP